MIIVVDKEDAKKGAVHRFYCPFNDLAARTRTRSERISGPTSLSTRRNVIGNATDPGLDIPFRLRCLRSNIAANNTGGHFPQE
jgi:hypothetical protein